MFKSNVISGGDFLEKTQAHVSAICNKFHDDFPKLLDGKQSLPEVNSEYLLRGYLAHVQAVQELIGRYDSQGLLKQFDLFRDAFSLFPGNPYVFDFLSKLLMQVYPKDCADLCRLCEDRTVVLHISCRARLSKTLDSLASYHQVSEKYVHLVVVGNPRRENSPSRLGFRLHKDKLLLPVPDSYEYLGDKVFFAYLILALVGRPRMVVKTDDEIHLGDPDLFGSFLKSLDEQKVDYAGRFVSCSYLGSQGWHVDKCLNTCLHHQGYQFPLPSHYAAGGFGYALSIDGLYACSSWYLGMRSFFAMKTVQLEDIYVGLAMEACSLRSQDCDPLIPRNCGQLICIEDATLPGLRRKI